MSDVDLRELERRWLEFRDLDEGIAYYRALVRVTETRCPVCSHAETIEGVLEEFELADFHHLPNRSCGRCGIVRVPDASKRILGYLEATRNLVLRLKEQAAPGEGGSVRIIGGEGIRANHTHPVRVSNAYPDVSPPV